MNIAMHIIGSGLIAIGCVCVALAILQYVADNFVRYP